MNTHIAQSQVFLMAFQTLPDETKKEVFQTLKEQYDETQDFYTSITEQEKKDILEGLSDIDSGKTTPHSQIMTEATKWLKNNF